jgi:hypothetical protein
VKKTTPKDVGPVINDNLLVQVISVPVAQNFETEWVDDFGDSSTEGTEASSSANMPESVHDDPDEIVHKVQCWDVVKTVVARGFCCFVYILTPM